jgi:ribonuclease HII
VTHLEPLEIDSINILNASIKAMQECVLKLTPTRIYHSGWKQPFYSKKRDKNSSGRVFTPAEIDILTSIPIVVL